MNSSVTDSSVTQEILKRTHTEQSVFFMEGPKLEEKNRCPRGELVFLISVLILGMIKRIFVKLFAF